MSETKSFETYQRKPTLGWEQVELKIAKLGQIPVAETLRLKLDETDPADSASLEQILLKIENIQLKLDKLTKKSLAHDLKNNPENSINPEEKESLEKINAILEKLEKSGVMLGKGSTACVYDDVDRCYKIIFNHKLYENHNAVNLEAEIQSDLTDININGTRVPKSHYSVRSGNYHAFAMEKLNASGLDEILSGAKPMPKTFNKQIFCSNLEKFVSAMHERRIYHRDLHEGNIMVDNITGLPYIIDFGQSCRSFGDENPYQKNDNSTGKVKVYSDDIENVRKVKSALDKFLKKIN